jgi:hypothetical protein
MASDSKTANADGLTQAYGTAEANVETGGKVVEGQYSKLVINFDYADLNSTTEEIVSEQVLPDNVNLKSAELYISTAFVGATGTLSIGLIQADDRSTAIDADGIDATIAVTAIDAIGDTVSCDGALIGTVITEPGLVTMTNGTADFTAGVGKLTLTYFHTA